MRDFLSWNFYLGRWSGVQVRLHVFFLLLAIFVLHACTRDPKAGLIWVGLTGLAVLLLSVLAHELGHLFAANRLGGEAEQVVLWPLGGLIPVNAGHDAHSDLLVALSGVMVNFAVCLVVAPALVALDQKIVPLLNLLSPPSGAAGWSWVVTLQWVMWINWMLAVVNVLPAFPMDGGRVLRAALHPAFGYRSAVVLASRGAMIAAVALCVVGWLVRESYPFAFIPMTLLGVFVFFSARQEADRLQEHDQDDGVFGYDFSQGYTSLDRHTDAAKKAGPGALRRWLDNRRNLKLRRQRQIEEDEERRVDAILAQIRDAGMETVSDQDRALLNRVSARYRNRSK
jgi:stage IV sporulation protein FB